MVRRCGLAGCGVEVPSGGSCARWAAAQGSPISSFLVESSLVIFLHVSDRSRARLLTPKGSK